MGLLYSIKASCFVSEDTEKVSALENNIAYNGTLVAVVLPTNCDQRCENVGIIYDSVTTLFVHQLVTAADDDEFRRMCQGNGINVITLTTVHSGPICPPPTNTLKLEEWRKMLFQYRPRF